MSAAPNIRSRLQRNLTLLTAFSFLLGVRPFYFSWLGYYHRLGLSTATAGMLWSVTLVFILLSDTVTGLIADLWDYRKTLIFGSALLTASFAGIYLAPDVSKPWVLLVASHSVLGVATTLVYTGTPQALLSKSLDELGRSHEYAKFTARNSSAMYIATALGGALGWLLMLAWPHAVGRQIAAAQALLTIGLVVVAWFTHVLRKFKLNRPRQLAVGARLHGFRQAIPAHLPLAKLLMPLVIIAICNEPCVFFVQAYVSKTGLQPYWSAILGAISLILVSALSLKVPSWLRRWETKRITFAAAVGTAVIFLGMALLPGRWCILAVSAAGAPCAAPQITALCAINDHVKHLKATAPSVFSTARSAGQLVAMTLLGWLFGQQAFGTTCLIWLAVCSACFVPATLLLYRRRAPAGSLTLSTETPPS